MFLRTIHVFIFAWLMLVMATLTSGKPIFVGYFSSWRKTQNKQVDMSKYTHINLSFAIPEEDGTITFDKELSIPETVKDIHSKGPKVLVSVGGWTGSKKISSIIADKTKSAKFTSEIIELVKTNELDGIDIDWEYPGKPGLECNKVDYENDTPNFLVFIKQLRSKFNTEFGEGKKLITMAVGMDPFHINKKASTDVGEFAKYVDYASIMAFDVNGGWSKTTGPNAPLNNEDGKGDAFSVASAIKSWTYAKWPANKLLIGLAFYGRALTATNNVPKSQASMYQPKEKEIPQGDWEDAKETADAACGVEATYTGQWLYQHLRQSALTSPEKAHKDWIRNWDKVSETPWLFNPENKTLITYDDPQSITAKVKFASEKGLAGAMVWAIDKDYKGELVAAMHSWPGSTSGDSTPDGKDESPSNDPVNDKADDMGQGESPDGENNKPEEPSPDAGNDKLEEPCEEPSPDAGSDKPEEPCEESPSDTADKTPENPGEESPSDTADKTPENPADEAPENPGEESPSDTADEAPENPGEESPSDTADEAPENPGKETCSTEGQLTCTAPGTSPDYTVCLYGSQLKLQCGPGTVCVTIEKSIYCGWGNTNSG
ncbi:hypothetical protein COEREDRAFT_88760 [Coemansia reversa NRRL 1564]|uniref:GH18 domain-containing protein n=1 Tax=Coemansia reversa (strain ATCC 12441 / NRRL 1564) TaxID=763665 RepID=A0A2G5B5V2_COERN|nr:hypothetical protein COEREDRAFT_88760 [Coemansia reversa NRRL 1564]|eukprot:PIA14370.1 hypothetical protein COEREDRAFT_88760 [Coemansia reversa NRRL 1564]